jgi:hypothetical protein
LHDFGSWLLTLVVLNYEYSRRRHSGNYFLSAFQLRTLWFAKTRSLRGH